TGGLRIGPETRERLRAAVGGEIAATDPPPGAGVADGIVVLDRVHRYGGASARGADAIRRGDGDEVVAALAAEPGRATWIATDPPAADAAEAARAVQAIRAGLVAAAGPVIQAARAGDATGALEALGA